MVFDPSHVRTRTSASTQAVRTMSRWPLQPCAFGLVLAERSCSRYHRSGSFALMSATSPLYRRRKRSQQEEDRSSPSRRELPRWVRTLMTRQAGRPRRAPRCNARQSGTRSAKVEARRLARRQSRQSVLAVAVKMREVISCPDFALGHARSRSLTCSMSQYCTVSIVVAPKIPLWSDDPS